MKKLFASLFFSLCLLGMAVSAHAAHYSQIVFFGDSLSDNGNLYNMYYKLIPSSPPYFQGRFSNGTTWAERVGKFYYDKYYIDVKNYALGGATAVYHWPDGDHFSPATLPEEVNAYFDAFPTQNRSQVLYSIWIGANDYFYDDGLSDNEATQKVVDQIAASITTLANRGGQNFLILNLPDTSRTPFGRSGQISPEKLHKLTQLHNQKLAAAINDLLYKFGDINITVVDIDTVFNILIDTPNVFNEKYHANITNTVDSCWTGSVTGQQLKSTAALSEKLRQTFDSQNDTVTPATHFIAASTMIAKSPSLAAMTNSTAQSNRLGLKPCANPQNYLFWDIMHPTATAHRILASFVLEELNKSRQ